MLLGNRQEFAQPNHKGTESENRNIHILFHQTKYLKLAVNSDELPHRTGEKCPECREITHTTQQHRNK